MLPGTGQKLVPGSLFHFPSWPFFFFLIIKCRLQITCSSKEKESIKKKTLIFLDSSPHKAIVDILMHFLSDFFSVFVFISNVIEILSCVQSCMSLHSLTIMS